jgi:hypothetical protein
MNLFLRKLSKAEPLRFTLATKFGNVDVQVVATKSALHFFDKEELEKEHGGRVKVWTDEEEWAVSCFPLTASHRI